MCKKFKFIQKSWKGESFASCAVYGSDFSVAHGGENDINRHKDTSKHKWYVDAAQQQNNKFWCKFIDSKFKLKSSESWTAFFWFSGWTQPPFEYCRSCC